MKALLAAILLWPGMAAALAPSAFTDYGAQTVRAAFLSRAASARAVAMGEAFTAVSDDASAVLGNPGGLGRVARLDAVAQYETGGDGISRNVGAIALPVGPGAVGIGVAAFSAGSYEVRDASGAKSGDQSAMDIAGTVGYGFANPGGLGLPGWTGLAVEFVSQGVGGSTVAGSLGTVLPLGGGLDLGLALQHMGAKASGFGLPSSLRAGLALAFAGTLRVAGEARVGLADKVTDVGAGAEWAPIPRVAIRAGYRTPLANQGWQGMTGLTAGAGLRLGNLVLDYAFQPYGELATSHIISLSWRQGAWMPAVAATADEAETEAAPGAAVAAAPAPKKSRRPAMMNVAVSDLEPQGVSASDAAVVADMLRGELVKTGSVIVLERQNMQKVMAEQAFQQTGCTSAECAVKLGKVLNVQRIITGSVGKLGDMYFVNVRIVDVESGSMVWSDRAEAKVVSALAKELPSLAQRLAKKMK
ncbi:MAG: CsgG/HfaB family protein [Candidatus Coatesbacteria bacterium]